MSEEEKKAIERLKLFIDMVDKKWKLEKLEITNSNKLKTILNIIEKQQEEIERLKNAEEYSKLGKETLLDTIHKQEKEIEELKKPKFILNTETGTVTKIHNDFISKDKVKEMIEELEENIKNYNESSYYDPFYNTDYVARVNAQIIILKSLLKEGEPDAK